VQKRLNRSICGLGTDLFGPKEPCIKCASGFRLKGDILERACAGLLTYLDDCLHLSAALFVFAACMVGG